MHAFTDKARRETFASVVYLESNARFGGGIGMGDLGLGVKGTEAVEDRLVGDLAGQADILRRNCTRRRTHDGAAPVRRGPREVRHSVRAEPLKTIADRLVRAREHKRTAAQHAAEKDLEPAVAPDIIERCPDEWACLVAALFNRSRQAF